MTHLSITRSEKYLLTLAVLILYCGVGVFMFVDSIYAADEEDNLFHATSTEHGGEILEGAPIDERSEIESQHPKETISTPPSQNVLEKVRENTYMSRQLGYTLTSPQDWNVYQIPSMSYVRVENRDARLWDSFSNTEREDYFKIEVVVLPSNGLSLEKWVERQNTTSYPLPTILEQKDTKVAGQEAIYQLEQFGSFISPVIFVLKGDFVYIINPSSEREEYKETIEKFVTNFTINE